MPSAISTSKPKAYSSQYKKRIAAAQNEVSNFNYDPTKDASYTSLAKMYQSNGDKAAQSSMADAAALNGGMGTSYATSAAQQARNDYNQQLASYVPELEQNAFNRSVQKLNSLRDADDTAYGRYRDRMSDFYNAKDYNLNLYAAKKSKSSSSKKKKSSSRTGGSRSSGSGASGGYIGGTSKIASNAISSVYK